MIHFKRLRVYFISLLVIALQFSQLIPFQGNVSAQASTNLQVSPGVSLVSENTVVSSKKMSLNIMNINLLDPYTTIQLGTGNPLTELTTTSKLAQLHTYDEHHVVGAVNGSFFHFDTAMPAYLVSRDNKIMNLGAVSYNSNDFMHTPAAFGILNSRQGLIDRFNPKITVSHHGKEYQIDSFNKARNDNESILFTTSYHASQTKTNPYGYEVVVTTSEPIENSNVSFGDTVIGKVTKVRDYGVTSSSVIPKNGFVLSANGTANEKIRDLKVGDEVSLKIEMDDKWKDANFMLAGGPLLVQQGKANLTIDLNSPKVTARSPHTAIAIDQTGNHVFFVTVDGRQPGVSEGMTLKEFANYLVSLGAYQAINLDGGGSTAMVARKHGDKFASLVNIPSDGGERRVSTILEAVSLAPYGEPTFVSAKQAVNGKLAIGASVDFKINYVLDQYYNSLPLDISNLHLEVEGDIGRIEGSSFIAEKAGTGFVYVYYGQSAQAVKLPVTVVDHVNRLEIAPKSIYLGKNQSQKLSAKAYDNAGSPVIIKDSSIDWSVSGQIGEIDETGVFIAGNTEASGSIKAVYGDKSISVPVTVSDKPLQLEGFDSLTNWKTENIRATSTITPANNKMIHNGSGALKLNYDFTSSQTGTTASYVVAKNPIPIIGKPASIGVWVNGDGNNHWLRGRLIDGNGKEVTIDFTEDSQLNWYGWKYVQAQIPANIAWPIKFDRIYVAEPDEKKQGKGSIYLDKLQAVYSSDYQEPYFVKNNPAKVENTKAWTITFNTPLDPKSATNKTIYVVDEYGTRQSTGVSVDPSGKVVKVTAPVEHYVAGKAYQLVVTTGVKSSKGISMSGDYQKIFEVK